MNRGMNRGMKPAVLCTLLLAGCISTEPLPLPEHEYALIWICLSQGGCEYTEELERIDRMYLENRACRFSSTRDLSFRENAMQIFSDLLPSGCLWLHDLSLAGHDLEPFQFCMTPGGFELELSLPNQDPTTSSQWFVEGQQLDR